MPLKLKWPVLLRSSGLGGGRGGCTALGLDRRDALFDLRSDVGSRGAVIGVVGVVAGFVDEPAHKSDYQYDYC